MECGTKGVRRRWSYNRSCWLHNHQSVDDKDILRKFICTATYRIMRESENITKHLQFPRLTFHWSCWAAWTTGHLQNKTIPQIVFAHPCDSLTAITDFVFFIFTFPLRSLLCPRLPSSNRFYAFMFLMWHQRRPPCFWFNYCRACSSVDSKFFSISPLNNMQVLHLTTTNVAIYLRNRLLSRHWWSKYNMLYKLGLVH